MQVRVGFVEAASWPLFCCRACLPGVRPPLCGQVTDPGGAVIPERRAWRCAGVRGLMRTVSSAVDGRNLLIGLGTGDYTIQASAPTRVLPELLKISLRPGTQTANL